MWNTVGDTSVIANLVDIDTVTHFRPADHTSGGAAAPLMPYLDYILFRDKPGYTMTLNIGGIANLHVANADRRRMFGFDTGPGNIISNYMCKVLFGLEYDKDGAIAASGKVDDGLMEHFMNHPFWDRPVPRSGWSQVTVKNILKQLFRNSVPCQKRISLLPRVHLQVKQLQEA